MPPPPRRWSSSITIPATMTRSWTRSPPPPSNRGRVRWLPARAWSCGHDGIEGARRPVLTKMPVRSTARRLWLGLSTLLGRRRGFFIPYRYAHRLVPPGGRPAYQPIEQLFEAAGGKFAAQLRALDEYADALRAIGRQPAPAPRWDQDWFPRLDAAMAYAIVRRHRPMRIVEVGSGHSTRFMACAVDDGGLATEILAIDPAPRAALRGL